MVDACREHVIPDEISAYFGIAGSSNLRNRNVLSKIIEKTGLSNCILRTDVEITLTGAFQDGPGILLIAGTGSVCMGKNFDGATVRTGGWGCLVDDCGSATWIGKQAIATAIKQRDGRLPRTRLAEVIYQALDIDSENQLNDRIYNPTIPPNELGKLATLVFGETAVGDSAALEILERATDHLESLVRAAHTELSGSRPPLALAGGLLEHHSKFRNALAARLNDFTITPPALPPAGGAALAAKTAVSPDAALDWSTQLAQSIASLNADESQRP